METTVITGGEKAIGEKGDVFTESQKTELIDLPLGIIKAKFRLVQKEIIQQERITKKEAKQAIVDLFKQKKRTGLYRNNVRIGVRPKAHS